MLKRLFSIITISLVLTGSFFSSYSSINQVYADDNTDAWTQVTTNEQLVEAFKYYCKSRDLTIEGSVADAVTSFTTKTFNGLCNTLGIDMTALQAQIKYQTDGNSGLRFLFSTVGIDAYNRIFAQFLQDNELSVGDEDVNKIVYSGYWYTYNGYSCLVYFIDLNINGYTELDYTRYSHILFHGTYFQYSPDQLVSLIDNGRTNVDINYASGNTLNYNIGKVSAINATDYNNYWIGTRNYVIQSPRGSNYYAYCSLVTNSSSVYLYPCTFSNVNESNHSNYRMEIVNRPIRKSNIPANDYRQTNIYINSNTINNNTYEGDTIINNEGDVINNNYPDPNPNPTPDPPTIPDSGGWQDFSLPDMPNDWLIYGMEKKFPFDIPFNILFALSLLNHEPEIPKFEGDIDLQVCTWHYDIDLTPFDDIATILRKFEVLGFIIGLAILTKNLINWG